MYVSCRGIITQALRQQVHLLLRLMLSLFACHHHHAVRVLMFFCSQNLHATSVACGAIVDGEGPAVS